ncbi:MAG: GTPase HflX, partial [Anaerolineales bacterium]|nr:GTPase HflX [Anaerolineales bacterium]
MARLSEPNGVLPERAFLVGTEFRNAVAGSEGEVWSVEESLDELAQLARTAGLTIVGRESQRLNHPNPATFIGQGKVEEIAAALEETGAEVVIFDDELSPRHQRELEEAFGEDVKLLDRTAL